MKAKRKEYRARPEVKESKKEYMKEYQARPEVKEHKKEYLKEYRARPEFKERKKEYQKQYRAEKRGKRLWGNFMRSWEAMQKIRAFPDQHEVLKPGSVETNKIVEISSNAMTLITASRKALAILQ